MITASDSVERNSIFTAAVGLIADGLRRRSTSAVAGRPQILGPDGRPALIPKAQYQFERRSAGRKGTLKTWIPRQLDTSQAALEREAIGERAIDLVNNDPSAAGVVDSFANTVVGPGLLPHPVLDAEILGIAKDAATAIENRQKWVFRRWSPAADAGGRMSFAGIAFLAIRQLIQFGEFFFALPMLSSDPLRPYMLSVQAIHPLRVKTPVDLLNRQDIKDGVEMDSNGAPRAYWIKKATAGIWSHDTSANFTRVAARAGHRHRILHCFITKDPEQVRGVSVFSPAMKMFKDLSDYLDAELVSNVVTAAFSLFIETSTGNPYETAASYANISETAYKSNGTPYEERFEELEPGVIMYGNANEKPHVIAAQRPGSTFQPFVKLIAKSVSMACGIPYPVLFKDFDGMNYASYRSAMLEAWRVFNTQRKYIGSAFCGPVWRMLLEESFLRGEFDGLGFTDFYSNISEFANAEWIGPPKGQIEPVKEVQADIIAIRNNLKTREETALEQGRDFASGVGKLAEEKQLLEDAGLSSELDESNASGMADSGNQEEQQGEGNQ